MHILNNLYFPKHLNERPLFASSEPFFVWLHLMALFCTDKRAEVDEMPPWITSLSCFNRSAAVLENRCSPSAKSFSVSAENSVFFWLIFFKVREIFLSCSPFRNIHSPKDDLPSINGYQALLLEHVTAGEPIVHVIFAGITDLNSATC